MSLDVIVVGGGHNGAVCAAYLARAGHRVAVIEQEQGLGGAVAAHAGTPLSPVIRGLRRWVWRDLGLAEHGLRLCAPSPTVQHAPGKPPLLLCGDPRVDAGSIARSNPHDALRWPMFVSAVQGAVRLRRSLDDHAPVDPESWRPRDLWSGYEARRRLASASRAVQKMAIAFEEDSVAGLVSEWFSGEPLCGLLVATALAGHDEGPDATGSALGWVVGGFGCPAAGDGFSGVAVGAQPGEVLHSALTSLGADVQLGERVVGVVGGPMGVRGVALASGRTLRASQVVFAMEPSEAARLVGIEHPTVSSPAWCARVDVELSALPSRRDPLYDGELWWARSVGDQRVGRQLARRGQLQVSSMHGVISSRFQPGRRATGDVLCLTVQWVPAGQSKKAVEEAVSSLLQETRPDLYERIEGMYTRLPHQVGSPHHLAIGSGQRGIERPWRGWGRYRNESVSGLWLGGAGAHPGGGITGVPGALCAFEMIQQGVLARQR